MQVEGYARLVVDPTGAKYLVEDFWNKTNLLEIYWDVLAEHLGDQLPSELKDVQVLCVFSYRCDESYDWYSGVTEYEDIFDLVHHVVISQGYKALWAAELREELKYLNAEEASTIQQDITEWEEFYGHALPSVNGEDFPVAKDGDGV